MQAMHAPAPAMRAPALPARRRAARSQAAGSAATGSGRSCAALGPAASPCARPLGQHLGRVRAPRVGVATTASPGPTTVAPPEGAEEEQRAPVEPINWYQQWYPVAILEDLDPGRPTPLKLLGKSLVLWRDGSGAWSCLEDRCPHRLAPLSEGRVEKKTGNLMCSYHGWEFDAGGACTAIPQIGDPRAKASALGSKRSCVASYPVKEAQGLLWVWADASPGAAEAAAAAPAATIPELDDSEAWEPRTGWFMRDVPISADIVAENVLDPCHAPFTHHGVQGRREQERGTEITPLAPPSKGGFICEQEATRANGAKFKAQFAFQAPCLIRYEFGFLGRIMLVYIVPTAMGWSRMITRFLRSKKSNARRPGLFGLYLAVMELLEANKVFEHAVMRNQVLDGDGYILHVQERILMAQAEGRKGWRRQYFMPGLSDTGVTSWRSWMDRFGRNLPTLPKTLADLPPEMSRRDALDRYTQHTQHCPHCQRALARIDAALPLLAAASVGLLLWAGLGLATGAAPPLSARVVGGVLAAAVAEAARRKLEGLRALFIFTDYVHQDRD